MTGDDAAAAALLMSIARHVERGELSSAISSLALWFADLQRTTQQGSDAEVRLGHCLGLALRMADELATLEEMALRAAVAHKWPRLRRPEHREPS